MKKILFVISDLHLGGAPASDGKPSFQMCSEKGRARLAEFIRYVADQKGSNREVHLVLNGDIVDILAESPFAPFTQDDDVAAKKLQSIFQHTEEVWKSLEALVGSGSKLTLLLGNHDIELSLPTPRRLLLDHLGPGHVEFIYDNQAFREGPVLIEHGNRYDGWNVVSHDKLREVRSAISRGELAVEFPAPAGSHMVFKVMNKIKQKYPFVDLLKPEDAGLLPLLAVFHPPSVQEFSTVLQLQWKTSLVGFDEQGIPTDEAYIGAAKTDPDQELFDLASELAGNGDPADIGAWDTVKDFIELIQLANTKDWDTQLKRLYRALRARAEHTWHTFDVSRESDDYLIPARAAAERGHKVIVFGHTHLAKRVKLSGGTVYLNSGTWADLIRVPEAVLTGDETNAMTQLKPFVSDLQKNQLDAWRHQVPTYAKIELDDGTVQTSDIYLFSPSTPEKPVPNGSLADLMV